MSRFTLSVGKASTLWQVSLAILLVIAPWIALVALRPPPLVPRLVAVPADAPGLNAPVSTGFADAPFFVFVNLSSRATWTVPNPNRSTQALGLKAAHRLLSVGIGVVLVRSIGPESFNALSQQGVRVHVAHPGSVLDLVRAYASGALAELSPTRFTPTPRRRAGLVPPAQLGQGAAAPAPRFLVPELGVEVTSVPKGALVARVIPRSRAERGGIQAGDVISRVGQNPIAGADALIWVARTLPSGVHVLVALERNGIQGELWVPP